MSAKKWFTADSWSLSSSKSPSLMGLWRIMRWSSRLIWVRRQCSLPLESRIMRLENLGCLSINELSTSVLIDTGSMGFFNPIVQWITWFISGRRKSLPAGVRGSSVSFSTEPIREHTQRERERERERVSQKELEHEDNYYISSEEIKHIETLYFCIYPEKHKTTKGLDFEIGGLERLRICAQWNYVCKR